MLFAERSAGLAFMYLLVPDKVLAECPCPDGEEMAGNGLSPIGFPFFVHTFKAASGHIDVVVDEHAITLVNTRRGVIAGGTLHYALTFDGVHCTL
jgi:hypothetical protein